MAFSGRFGPLQERPFRLVWLARTSSAFGDALIPVALAFAVLDVGGSATRLGLVLASFTIARVAFTLAGGVWADRLPRRLVMIASDVVRAAVDAFTAFALISGFMTFWMFLATAATFGAASAFFGPASTGLVPQTVSPARLQKANALLGLSQSATSLFGPAVSGLLVATVGPGWVFGIDSASFVASAGFLVALRIPHAARAVSENFLRELVDGWREVTSRSWLWKSFVVFALGNLGGAGIWVLGPLVAQRSLGGAGAWGIILTGQAAGGILGGTLAYRLHPRRPLVAAFGAWLLTCLPLLALAPPLPTLLIAAAGAAFALGITFGNTIWETMLQQQIPAAALSRVTSYDLLLSFVFIPIGSAAAGPLADGIGLRATLLASAALIVVVNAGIFLVPSVRRLEAPQPSAWAEGGSRGPAPRDPLP